MDVTGEEMFSVAPGEGHKPIPILTDKHFEEMRKYPRGNGGLTSERKIKLTVRKYFNQRLLDVDGRFAKDIEYLLTAQYAVESKQVFDDANIVFRQTQGHIYRREPITAGTIRNPEFEVIQQMILSDNAYCFLKQVRGSPVYFQRVICP